jgi:hypothetical protein
LVERGFYVKEMNSGWYEWLKEGLPTEKGAERATTARST